MKRAALVAAMIAAGCGGTSPAGPDAALDAAPDAEIIDVTVGDLTFVVRTAGPVGGEPVLMLHGFPETSYEWRAQIRGLAAAGYHVYAPDQRGYSPGARPAAIDQYAMPLLVGDALGLADALGLDRFHVVGHDWGSAVAWGLALTAPDRIASFTSISVPHPWPYHQELADPASCQHAASAYMDSFVMPGSEDSFLASDGALLRTMYSQFPDDPTAVYLPVLNDKPAMTAAMNWYRANIAGRQVVGAVDTEVTVPTMLIYAPNDAFICPEAPAHTGDYVAAPYRFVQIDGAGHFVPEMAADQVTALVLEQLRAHPAAP